MRSRLLLLLSVVVCTAAGMAHGQNSTVHAATPSQRYGLAAPDPRYTIETEGVDRAAALAADIGAPKSTPLRYALSREIHNAAFSTNQSGGGEWHDLADGMALWRLPVHATGALTLDFGFRRLFLPPGAQLFIGNADQRLGPYSDADNPRSGKFWTPLLYGDTALVEVLLPQKMTPFLQIDLGTVHVGYRDIFAPVSRSKSFFDPGAGSGSCNVDTICPQGDPWRDEINAEAILVLNGGFCSGQLLNDARNDHAPYLSTANHCITTQDDAASLVVYWKYESPVCRAIGSTANGAPVSTADAIPQTGGASLVATYQPADFTLVKLNTTPPAAAHVYWNGWDRSETVFSDAVVLHHPEADAKRISFSAGTVTVEDDDGNTDVPGAHHWRVDHYSLGTTEAGSSGSGLLDASHHLRGVLSGGAADCSDPGGEDEYGRLSTAWEGGGTSASRLRDWLDPDASGATSHDGLAACALADISLEASANPALAGQQITISANVSGGMSPYTYAFDLDGDGAPDNLDAHAASLIASYPNAFAGNVSVRVTDSAGCTGTASRALIVQAQSVVFEPTSGFGGFPGNPVEKICGNADTGVAPGERFDAYVHLTNTGSVATSGGYAVFAQDPGVTGQADITLETPAVPIPTLAPGASTAIHMTFAIAPDATCGAPVRINYLGTADDNGFTSNPANVASLNLTSAGQCQPAACAAQIAPVALQRGNFLDPHRSGSGMTQFVAPVQNADPTFFGIWFTGDSARYPTWYVVQNSVHANQVNSTLYQTQQITQNPFATIGNAVGTAQVSFVSPQKFIYTWVLNGVAGGGIYVPVVDDPASSLRSWFNVNEGGWGTFDQLFPSFGSGGQPYMFNLAFIYDGAGTPRWTIASDASYRDGNVLNAMVSRPACPACVWLDYSIGAQAVGPVTYSFTGDAEFISTSLVLPAAYAGSWIRSNLPLTPLVAPE